MNLGCWRVPSKIWRGLPDPKTCKNAKKFEAALAAMNELIFCGFNELKPTQRQEVVRHVMDKTTWTHGGDASKVKVKKGSEGASSAGGAKAESKPAVTTGYELELASGVAKAQAKFVVPVPGKLGAPKE